MMVIFGLGFTKSDVVRAIWCFIFGFVGFYALSAANVLNAEDPTKAAAALLTGALLAGLSAVKNFVLRDGTTLKG